MKVSLTARIDPTLAAKLTAMQEQTGKDRTACLETALTYFFEHCPDNSAYTLPADQALTQALIAALSSPAVSSVLQQCITGIQPVTQPVTQPVLQPVTQRNTARNTDLQAARELVDKIRNFQKTEGCNIKEACKLADCSDKKYYARVRLLEAANIET